MSNDNVAALLQQGHEQLDRGQNQAALQIFQQAEQREPENPQVLFGLGLACYRLEQYQESVDYLTQSLNIEPCYILALAYRGRAYRGLKLEEPATADFEQVLQLEPQTHQDWRGRGLALYELKRYEEAIVSYDKAIEINSDYYYAWGNRGNALGKLGRYSEAIASFDKAIEINPDNYNARNGWGVALYELGKYEEAIASCDKAIEINPDYYYAWGNRGNALDNLGKYSEAIASCDKAIEINPDNYNAWGNRGGALNNLGKYSEAIASYDKAIEINPDDYNAWGNRGSALDNLGKYSEAIASCDKAIEINPDYYNAWGNRGGALNNLGKYSEAIASCDKAIEINPDYYYAWKNRGWALLNLKRYNEAFQNWEDGRKNFNLDTPEHREGRGELYYSEAQAYYQLGRQEANLDNLLKAKQSYHTAFTLLDTPQCRQRQLEILQDLIRVCQYISTPKQVQELLNQGTDLLERWLQDSNFSDENYIHFKQKFAGFNQYQVDTLAQSSEPEQHIQAIELAEERKNTCLGWLQYGKAYKAPSLTYNQIQQQFNPHTAAIYWHISPAAITTFILKHNQPPQILQLHPLKSNKKRSPFPFFNQPEKSYPATANQLREFEDWLNQWKQDYRHYSQAPQTTSIWRQSMESLLRSLEYILHIRDILPYLRDIDQLILIPHRDLHLLPLHYLFPSRFTITYLPSFQIGLNLQPYQSDQSLLSLENLDIQSNYCTLTSNILTSLYPQCQRLNSSTIDKKRLIQDLKSNTGTFQFIGHAYHNLDNPKTSALQLTIADQLTMAEIFDQLNFGNYNLIFLSACETGITNSHNLIDEYVGLISAFLAKGASYVISTLWTVDERSTAWLTIRFYQYLKAGEHPVSALKQAQDWLKQVTNRDLAKWYLELAQDIKATHPHASEYLKTEAALIQQDSDKLIAVKPPFEHPYHWAGFIITGNPF
ncbi:CHAT domain-containing tetratricopeptide repeat protein [Coleofasciculus chthonoplastes]|uniref:CHAT domain-containing tetratricopeptide repeat protein n=1 Tax=Coleofasciculus chthonoplastes TaxID=64178 RepID=UPI0032F6D7FF